MMTVPIAGICDTCERPIRNREPYTYVEAVVWRRTNGQGLPDRVVSQALTGRVRCTGCGDPTASVETMLLFDV